VRFFLSPGLLRGSAATYRAMARAAVCRGDGGNMPLIRRTNEVSARLLDHAARSAKKSGMCVWLGLGTRGFLEFTSFTAHTPHGNEGESHVRHNGGRGTNVTKETRPNRPPLIRVCCFTVLCSAAELGAEGEPYVKDTFAGA